jgi:Superinfection immunity protein
VTFPETVLRVANQTSWKDDWAKRLRECLDEGVSGPIELIVAVAIYLLPAIVAYRRDTRNRAAVAIVDIFLGWTFIGWVVALAMAASGAKEDPPAAPPTVDSSEPRLPRGSWELRD